MRCDFEQETAMSTMDASVTMKQHKNPKTLIVVRTSFLCECKDMGISFEWDKFDQAVTQIKAKIAAEISNFPNVKQVKLVTQYYTDEYNVNVVEDKAGLRQEELKEE